MLASRVSAPTQETSSEPMSKSPVVIEVIVAVLFQNPLLGAVIGAAMLCNIVIAGLAGVLVPLTLQRWKADPAISSSIFVTMTTDSMGFLVFLGLAVVSGLVG
jgi:magnesium transporter